MSETKPLRFITLSRTQADWRCPRSRFWGYEYEGRGLSKATTSQALFTGTTLHDALAVIGLRYQAREPVNIDEIAITAFKQMKEALLAAPSKGEPEVIEAYANEQATLVEGLIRGYYRHVWPKLLEKYPTIIGVEQEATYSMSDDIKFIARPDLIMADKDGGWHYIEFKSTSSKREEWVNSWDTAIQLHSSVKAVQQTFGILPEDVTIVGFYKGSTYYGKQSSVFCLDPTTRILTRNLDWEKIGSLKVGDTIAAFDEEIQDCGGKNHARYWRSSKVLNIGRINLPSVKLYFDDGTTITCSKDHQWLTTQTNAGMGAVTSVWRKSCNLRPKEIFGSTASKVIKILSPWDIDRTYEAGYLSGILDGEGSLSHIKRNDSNSHVVLSFSQKPGKILSKVSEALIKMGARVHGPYEPYNGRTAGHLSISNREEILSILGKVKPQRLIDNLNLDKLGRIKPNHRPVTLLRMEEVGIKEVVTIETSTKTLIAEGLASHNCYGYKRAGSPPFSKDMISYDYKAGYKKEPVWEMPEECKGWIANMPDEVLANQFPMTAPIFVNEDMIESFFKQRTIREQDIKETNQLLAYPEIEPNLREELLNEVYPQKFESCQPAYGFGCEFKKLCFGFVQDPTTEGFELRVPHMEAERKQMNLGDDGSDEVRD